MTTNDRSRRAWLMQSLVLGAALAAGEGAEAPAAPRAAPRAHLPDFTDPAENLRHFVRMQGDLQERDTPWWFTGVMFAVHGDNETPRPLMRFEGMEIYWFEHVPEGYILGGNTVTFFRDFETQEFLQELRNPWTGKLDVVKPAVQGGNLGFHYGVEGIWPVRLSGEPLGNPEKKPLRLQWHAQGEHVWLQHQTVYPVGMPPMHGQRQTLFTRRSELMDRRITALPASFSSTVFMAWPKWMEMRDQPGHVIWHASGVKLRSVADLPAEYRARAEREYPERLTARPIKNRA